MELKPSSVFKNGQDVWSSLPSVQAFSSKPVFMILVAILVILFGLVSRAKNSTNLSHLLGISFGKRSTGIPSVSMWTILKSIYFHGTDIARISREVAAEHGGIFRLSFPGLNNFVLITNPSMLQKLYMSAEPGHHYKPNWYSKFLFQRVIDGLVSSTPDIWKRHRNAISKSFTYNGLVRQLSIVEEHAKRFILTLHEAGISKPVESKPVISFDQQVTTLIFRIISHIAAGTEMDNVSEEEKTRFQANFKRLQEILSHRFYHYINVLDFVWKYNPLKKELEEKVDQLSIYMLKLISEIRKQFDTNTTQSIDMEDDMAGKSLVDVMIKAGFSNEEIFTELTTLLVAGHDTSNNGLKLLLFLLAKNKTYQNKCREEIDQMFNQLSASNTHEISMEALKSLTFLDMCIKECLRLYPTVPVFGRQLRTPIQLDENTFLPQNTIVITSLWALHGDPKVYPEPKVFNPDRFLPENVKKRQMCEYMPFSVGPRNCIGFKLATMEIKVLAAYILHNFEVCSEMSMENLNKALIKKYWPFPDLGIEVHPRQ